MSDDKLTIVGPEPTAPGEKTPHKKVNIEALLLMAKYDDDFRRWLFSDREKALSGCGIDFTQGERLLLTNITDEQLSENIEEFRVPGVTKKSLTNWAKAAAIVLLLSSVAVTDAGANRLRLGISPDSGEQIIIREDPGPPFISIKVFSPQMKKILEDIKQRLKSGENIEDIMKEYKEITSKELRVPNEKKTIKVDAVKLLMEIEENRFSGYHINEIIKKYEEVMKSTKPVSPPMLTRGINPDR